MSKTVEDMWHQGKAFSAGEQKLLADIGSAYLEIEQIDRRKVDLLATIDSSKELLGKIRNALGQVSSELIKDAEVGEGNYTIDFDEQRIVPNNGQTSNSVDS